MLNTLTRLLQLSATTTWRSLDMKHSQLAIAAAFASEPTKKSAVTPVEQSDAVGVVAL